MTHIWMHIYTSFAIIEYLYADEYCKQRKIKYNDKDKLENSYIIRLSHIRYV